MRIPEIEQQNLLTVMDEWENHEGMLREFDPASADAVSGGGTLLAPLRFPRKLVMVGANYYDHIAEMSAQMGVDPPSRGEGASRPGGTPFLFLLPPTTTIIGSGDQVRLSADPSLMVDWEAEVAIVIGRTACGVSEGEAMDHVAGFTIVNDITARGLLHRSDALGAPFSFDWLRAKGRDTYCPMGPGVTPRWLVPDPGDLAIQLWVNGDLKQNSNTAEMVFDMPSVISSASHHHTLEPGDVIATGTPAGVGAAKGESLKDGDEIRIVIPPLGELKNPVRIVG